MHFYAECSLAVFLDLKGVLVYLVKLVWSELGNIGLVLLFHV